MRTLLNSNNYLKKTEKGSKHQFITIEQQGDTILTYSTVTNLNNNGHFYTKQCKSIEHAQRNCLERISEKLDDGFALYGPDGKKRDVEQVKYMIQFQLEKLSPKKVNSPAKKHVPRSPISRQEFRETCQLIDKKRKHSDESFVNKKKKSDDGDVFAHEIQMAQVYDDVPSPIQQDLENLLDGPVLDESVVDEMNAIENTYNERISHIESMAEIQQREWNLIQRECEFQVEVRNHEEMIENDKYLLTQTIEEYRAKIERDEVFSNQLNQERMAIQGFQLELVEKARISQENIQIEKENFKKLLKESFLNLIENMQ